MLSDHTPHRTPPFKPQNTNLPGTENGPPKKCFFMELPRHPSLWDKPRNCYVSGIGLPRVYLYTIIWHISQVYTLSDQFTSWYFQNPKHKQQSNHLTNQGPFATPAGQKCGFRRIFAQPVITMPQKINQKNASSKSSIQTSKLQEVFFSDVWRNSSFSQNTKPRFWDFPTSASSKRDTNDWSLKT